ncbi:hypothetical protein B0H14DRAFT_2638483 [Mycena olivaceomarginata]|nr:hypothetical protein B0H14DRAFT_2638483 [Mycena olivaceomarginata]
MPAVRWKPSPEEEAFLQYLADGDRVRCTLCHGEAQANVRPWISRKGLKDHLRCSTHLTCYSNYLARTKARDEQLEQLTATYGAERISEYPQFPAIRTGHVAAMFSEPGFDSDIFMDSPPSSVPQLIEELGQNMRPEPVTQEEMQILFRQEYERMLEDAYRESQMDEDAEGFIGDEMPKEDLGEDDEEDCFDFSLRRSSEYHPYPSKTAMLLDVMDNLPRCRFTSTQMSLVIHFAKQLGVPDVPSLPGLRKIQQKLQSSCGSKPVKTQSHLGNIFYMNDIRDSIARDMANPLVAPHMHFYPEENDGPISETYQAERWMEYTPSQLTPMFSRGFKRFWIEELACLRDGTFVIPHTWIVRNAMVERTVAADDLELDYSDLIAEFGANLTWVDDSTVPAMPNEMRKLVDDDEDLYVVMVSPWADDVSGNKSKQYNKHMNMYTGNGCLPGRLLQQEFNIHYISTSPHASSAEQFSTFRDHVQSTEKEPIKCYNAVTKRRCRCILRTPGLPADNPQQSEECCHMGSNANFPCRKCKWGGTNREKESDTVFHECHLTGVARNAREIRETLEEQLRLSMLGDAKAVEDNQRKSGDQGQSRAQSKSNESDHPRRKADEIAAELKTWFDAQPGDKMNPLLDLVGLDPSQDTPVELLHTISWSTDISGLTVPPIRAGYMVQYKNNLIGKHFKTLMQALAFHIHHISTPEQFVLVKAAGELGARLWVPEIDNMEDYLAQLKIAIANVLDAFDAVDPCRILVKIKLHLLAHIPDDVRRFGPSIRFATEIYEAYNAVFRLCSVFSNRLAPSRDISRKFAAMARVKHFLSGGYWWDSSTKQWIQAGNAVQQILLADPVFQRHLGWVSPSITDPGLIKPFSLQRRPALKWSQTKTSTHWTSGTAPLPESWWRPRSRSHCANYWTRYRTSGRREIPGNPGTVHLRPGTAPPTLVGRSYVARMDQRSCRGQVQSFVVLSAAAVQFVISVQHDCREGDCQPTVVHKEFQEREETSRNVSLIKHSNDDHFVINMAGLHNFVKLCRALPRDLTDLQPLFPDRVTFHKEAAEQARALRAKGRAKTAERRRAKAAEKKREAELAAAAARQAEEALVTGEEIEQSDEEPNAAVGEPEEGTVVGDVPYVAELEVVVHNTRARKRMRSGVRVVCEMDKKSYGTLAKTRSEKPDSAKIFGRPKVQPKIEMKMTLESNPRET